MACEKKSGHYSNKSQYEQKSLKQAEGRFRSLSGTLSCEGKFQTSTMHKGKNYIFKIYKLNGQAIENLMSREIANLMEMIIIFDQGGFMKGEPMKIHQREDAKPYCIMTASHTISTSNKSKKQSGMSRRRGYNRKSHPTDRLVHTNCSSKKEKIGHVHICVDLKRCNLQSM